MPDARLEARQWKRRIDRVLARVADCIPDGHIGLSVLLGSSVQEVAKAYNVRPHRVRAAARLLERTLRLHSESRLLDMNRRNPT